LEGEELERALDLFHDHTWRLCNKPEISAVQLAELVPVLAPLYEQQRPAKAAKPKTTRKIAKPANPQPSPSSSRIPSPIRSAVVKRDGWSCQRCGRSIWGIRYGLQHRRPRGMGGSKLLHTMANLVVLCGWSVDPGTCTALVEVEDREGATREGWLVPSGVDPEEWPVLRHGWSWMQPGETWELAEPHPRQIEEAA
jgi:5-methylcytosine-specific restriction endonuclease McrA